MPDSPRPNVVTVMCDQLRYDVFSYMNHPVMKTPNIDRLAEEGVVFTDAICTYPLCGPSRAAMLSGCYSYDDRYLPKNREPEWEDVFKPETMTVDQALDRAGYHVEYHGKWHTGNGHRDCYRGDNVLFGHQMHHYHDYLAERYTPPSGPEYRIENYSKWPYKPWPVDDVLSREASENYNIYHSNHFGVMEIADEDTMTAYTARQTVDFIKSAPREPFAVTCSILHPHLPYTPNPTYAAMYDPAEMPVPFNLYAYHYQPLSLQPGKPPSIPELLPEGADGLGQCQALYFALVKEIDDWFGRILDALENRGLTENTLVIFISDHGHLLGSHNAIEKFQFFEESIRVPMVMRYPAGMPAGTRIEAPATGADLAPTILDYCGAEPLPQFHGRSLRPVVEGADLSGAKIDNPGDTEWAFCENREFYTCFRSHEWKVAFDPEGTPIMVFNLREDPGEFTNLLETDAAQRREAERLAAELRQRIPTTRNAHWLK